MNKYTQKLWDEWTHTSEGYEQKEERIEGVTCTECFTQAITQAVEDTAKMCGKYIGDSIHTAFRKGSDCDEANQIWHLIKKMPPEEWEKVCNFVADCLKSYRPEEFKE